MCVHACVCVCADRSVCPAVRTDFRFSETVSPCTPSKTRPAVVSMAVRSLLGGAPLRVFLRSLAHSAVDM